VLVNEIEVPSLYKNYINFLFMFLLIILIASIIAFIVYSGRRGSKLYREIRGHLIQQPSWTEERVHHVWLKYNKQIIDMELKGLSPEQIAQELNSEKYI